MLTSDLLRVRVSGGAIVPQLVDVTRKDLLGPAADMIAVVARSAEAPTTRGELDEAVDAVIGTHKSGKVLRGLEKLLADRCDAVTDTPIPPIALRERVFRRARERAPIVLEHDDTGRPTADAVLDEVGAELGLSGADVAKALYADLPHAQVVTGFRPIEPEALLQRYNVALVQGILLRATEVRIALHQPTVPRLRQLLRHVKFHQLVHRAEREDDVLTLILDGPLSLFQQSTRYGLQLAAFFPALLLQDGGWLLEAKVRWGPTKREVLLEVTPAMGLVSHLSDTGAYASRERQWFVERFEAQQDGSPWRLTDDVVPIELGGRGVVLPDFGITDGTRRAWIEIVGYWRKDWLVRRLEGLRRHGPGNLILAVSRKLAVDKATLDDLPVEVVPFSEIVPVKAVLEAVEKVAR